MNAVKFFAGATGRGASAPRHSRAALMPGWRKQEALITTHS